MAILVEHIVNGVINADKLAANAVEEAKVATGAITSSKLAANAVNTSNVVNGAITIDKSVTPFIAGIALNLDANVLACTFSRISIGATGLSLTSGTIYTATVFLCAGTVVTNITIASINAAVSPTVQIVGLYNANGSTKLGQSADKGNEAWAGNTLKTFALSSPYTVPTSGIYIIAFLGCFTSGLSLAKIAGSTPATALMVGMNNGTADTGRTTLPDSLGAITSGNVFFAEIR